MKKEYDYCYSKFPAPESVCGVCFHRHGRMISALGCKEHSEAERQEVRRKEKGLIDQARTD